MNNNKNNNNDNRGLFGVRSVWGLPGFTQVPNPEPLSVSFCR